MADADGAGRRPHPNSDVDPLVWGSVAAGALAAVTMLFLLITGQDSGRAFLLVFAVPALALAGWTVLTLAARPRGGHPGRGRPDGAAEPPRDGD